MNNSHLLAALAAARTAEALRDAETIRHRIESQPPACNPTRPSRAGRNGGGRGVLSYATLLLSRLR